MTARERSAPPVVAVYRRVLLGPSETFVRNEALALRRYSALFVGEERTDGLPLPPGRVVVGVPGGRYQRALRHRLPGFDPHARMARACRDRGVALVHSHFGTDSLPALDLARALGVPLVVTYHGYDASLSDEALRAYPDFAPICSGARSCSRAPPRSSPSRASSRASSCARARREARLHVHHVGVPLGPSAPDGPREPVVLFVGRHVEKKGIGDLLEAMARVPRVGALGAAGRRGQRSAAQRGLEEHARRLRARAQFAGWQTRKQIAAAAAARSGCLCVPQPPRERTATPKASPP